MSDVEGKTEQKCCLCEGVILGSTRNWVGRKSKDGETGKLYPAHTECYEDFFKKLARFQALESEGTATV